MISITDMLERLSPTWRARLRIAGRLLAARGVTLLVLACGIGTIAGAMVTGMSWAVQRMHVLLFGIDADVHLSGTFQLAEPIRAFLPAVGGLVLGATIFYLRWRKFRAPIDPIEANALHGGRMSIVDTVIVAVQTMISSGFGASVGMEAAYTQTGSGVASTIARLLKLRRADVRTLVGCGAAGAIAAAFGAPLTGAFYAFELVIGVYSVAIVAPVMAAAVSASLTAGLLGAVPFPIHVGQLPAMAANQYLPFLVLGLAAGAVSIAIMQLVTLVERIFGRLAIHAALRPVFGGLLVGLLALITPQVLSSGHGALHHEFAVEFGIGLVAQLFVLKLAASTISLGSGFRGGLFFASLFLGALLGKIFAATMGIVAPHLGIDSNVAAVVGMTSLAVGVVGGPLTMTFLALESTGNLVLTGVVLAASIVSAVLVRETFGYSFSTWRFHLRGETIRSAHDVGWMRDLTVRSMMRKDVPSFPADMSVADLCKLVPLGSAQRVIATDGEATYVGILVISEIHGLESKHDDEPVRNFARYGDTALVPSMNVQTAAALFTKASSEELAVVDTLSTRQVIGLLTEAHLLRRYAEQLDKARRDLSGES